MGWVKLLNALRFRKSFIDLFFMWWKIIGSYQKLLRNIWVKLKGERKGKVFNTSATCFLIKNKSCKWNSLIKLII